MHGPPETRNPTAMERGGARETDLAGWPDQRQHSNLIPFRARGAPRVVAKPYAGHFAATFLERSDGSEVRLQIFPDPHAAAWSAKLLNMALAEARI